MTNLEQAKMSRAAGFKTYLNNNAAAYAGNAPFIALKAKFETDHTTLLGSAAAANPDNSGFSVDKQGAKEAAGENAATLCASAQVKLESIGRFSIALSLHDAETFYTKAADGESIARLQAVHKIMSDNLADLTDYVTATELDDLNDLINTYINTEGSSEEVHAVSPALTAAFKGDLKLVDSDIKNLLKLGKKYKKTNPAFYNGLVAAAGIPAVNVHHTTLHVTVIDQETGLPLPGAQGSVSNTGKTGVTNNNGFFEIDNLPGGNPTLTVTANGFKDYVSVIHINSGSENDFSIQMQKP